MPVWHYQEHKLNLFIVKIKVTGLISLTVTTYCSCRKMNMFPSHCYLINVWISYWASWDYSSSSVKWRYWSLPCWLLFRIFNNCYGMSPNQSECTLVKIELVNHTDWKISRSSWRRSTVCEHLLKIDILISN